MIERSGSRFYGGKRYIKGLMSLWWEEVDPGRESLTDWGKGKDSVMNVNMNKCGNVCLYGR